jgi:hypothetical protein
MISIASGDTIPLSQRHRNKRNPQFDQAVRK